MGMMHKISALSSTLKLVTLSPTSAISSAPSLEFAYSAIILERRIRIKGKLGNKIYITGDNQAICFFSPASIYPNGRNFTVKL